MSATFLFPVRVPIGTYRDDKGVDHQILITREFYRALNQIVQRLGGSASGSVPDSFGDGFGATLADVFGETDPSAFGQLDWAIGSEQSTVPADALILQDGLAPSFFDFAVPPDYAIQALTDAMFVAERRSNIAPSAITPSGSPFVYTVDADCSVVVMGGTVSAISFGRQAASVSIPTSGMFSLSTGDTLTVTYTVAPTMTLIPR